MKWERRGKGRNKEVSMETEGEGSGGRNSRRRGEILVEGDPDSRPCSWRRLRGSCLLNSRSY